jgi:hypothetical protein
MLRSVLVLKYQYRYRYLVLRWWLKKLFTTNGLAQSLGFTVDLDEFNRTYYSAADTYRWSTNINLHLDSLA